MLKESFGVFKKEIFNLIYKTKALSDFVNFQENYATLV